MSRILGKAINPLVGLAAETYQHNKDKKSRGETATSIQHPYDGQVPSPDATQSSQDLPPRYRDIASSPTKEDSASPRREHSPSDNSDEGDLTDDDEDDWVRDETQEELQSSRSPVKEGTEPSKIIQEFFHRHPDHLRGAPFYSVPCPVIIPQRRPNAKSRGFVRAYAPVLQDAGIDQSTFLDFITGFERAIKGQGYFNAFNVAVGLSVIAETAAHGPSITVHLAAMAVHISVETGRRLYESYKTNGYLDLMNEHLFKPHGLYALIMSYKPGSSHISQLVDVSTNNASAVAAHEGGRSKLRAAAGQAREDQLPECAPLIFPKLEQASDQEKENAFKRAMNFMGEYSDKKAQATWQQKNPDSKLNIPGAEPQFASSWGDPRHQAYSGGIINLLSGGRSGGRRQERRMYRDERSMQRRQLRAARRGREYTPSIQEMRKERRGVGPDDHRPMRDIRRDQRQKRKDEGRTPISFVKRQLGENVLYLMIVNLPSEQEMAAAKEMTKKSGIFSF